MITRQQIAGKLEELKDGSKLEKRVLVEDWLKSLNVEQKDIDKIVDDLQSYGNY